MKTINVTRADSDIKHRNMRNRCYAESVHRIKPWYADCTVCPEWLDDPDDPEDESGRIQFYEWINNGRFYEIENEPTVELDHNILVKNNTVYAPDRCIFVPHSINSMFGGSARKSDNGLPQGVKPQAGGKYRTTVPGIHDVFDTPEEAWAVWAEHKKAHIITVQDAYYGKIPDELYKAMINWIIEITD